MPNPLDAVRQGLSRQPGHDHEWSAEDVRIAFRHNHAGCGKAHFGESILDDRFQLHPPWIGIGVTEAQDQRPQQRRCNTVECETEDRGVKAALNARWSGYIRRVRAPEGARQVMQQPLAHFCVMDRLHRDELPPPQRQCHGYHSQAPLSCHACSSHSGLGRRRNAPPVPVGKSAKSCQAADLRLRLNPPTRYGCHQPL